MVKRIVVLLEQSEYSALLNLALDDLRNPADELRHILRLEIEKRNASRNDDSELAVLGTKTLQEIRT